MMVLVQLYNKYLMTGPKGNSEVEGKQKSLFLAGPVIKCIVIHPNSRVK